MDTEVEAILQSKKRNMHFEWIPLILIKPRSTILTINKEQKPVWLTPLLILSVLALLLVLVGAPIRRNTIQMGLTTPPDFQYYSAEQQTQFMNAQATQTSPIFLYMLPLLFGLASIWIAWFLLSSVLHLVLTLSGSHATSQKSFNLVSWTMLPLGVRTIVQVIAMLITRSTINGAGLSGLIGTDAQGILAYVGAILGLIDIYLLWQGILLIIGVRDFSNLSRGKAWGATLISLAIFLVIFALPGFLKSILSQLTLTQYYFF